MQTTSFDLCPLKVAGDVAAPAAASTPDAMAGRLGAMALPRWKPATFAIAVQPSAASAQGVITAHLKAGGDTLKSITLDVSGAGLVADKVDVDLSAVQGDTLLTAEIDVDTATDGGVTLDVYSRLEVRAVPAGGCA